MLTIRIKIQTRDFCGIWANRVARDETPKNVIKADSSNDKGGKVHSANLASHHGNISVQK